MKPNIKKKKKRIMKVASDLQPSEKKRSSDQLKPIINRILACESVTQTLFELDQDLKKLFDADKVTIYALDRAKKQLFSRNFKSEVMQEIRIDISPKSLSGFAAYSGKILNIKDCYDQNELSKYHPQLTLDKSWDKKLNYRTKSMLVIPLPHNKKLMGVLQVINKLKDDAFSDRDLQLAKDLSIPLGSSIVKMQKEIIGEKVKATSYAIHSAETLDKLFLNLKTPLIELFEAEMVTIYSVDTQNKEIFSKVKTGESIDEIRLPIDTKSIAGCVALVQEPMNIADVHDAEELKKYHSKLTFDSSWDQVSGRETKSTLVIPLLHKEKLVGILQLINKNGMPSFSEEDQKNAKDISEALTLALLNQKQQKEAKASKFSYLTENGIITEEELKQLISKARSSNIDIETLLIDELKVPREQIGKSYETFYNLPYYGYSDSVLVPHSNFAGLNINYLKKNLWLPIKREENSVTILIDNPEDYNKVQSIQTLFSKKELILRVGLKGDILDFLNASPENDDGNLEQFQEEEVSSLLSALQGQDGADIESIDDDEELNAISESDSTIVKLVNKFLIDAYDQKVSDIHIEPGLGKKPATIRFRKDGMCRVYEEIPPIYKMAIISRLKIMSKLDISEKRLPQDGKIKMKYGSREIEYRVATFPTVGGNEDAVIRILAASDPIPLDKMFFTDRNLNLIKEKAAKPYGLILVVGPTGSGKTTTLHSTLGHINTPKKKIWTAEDPVEITQPGLRQMQMQPKIGLTFARALRAFLRGDPDVIMVGEMRDLETASIGLEASLTGHLVFSTLHTNSAPETINRLLDMGMNSLNFADALLLIVAQRLIPTLCEHCREDYHPEKKEYDLYVQEYGGEEKFMKEVGIPYTPDLTLRKANQCEHCNQTGYLGRLALHEVLGCTEALKPLIHQRASVQELRKQAESDGMTSVKQDGIRKVFLGYTDMQQVLAVSVI